MQVGVVKLSVEVIAAPLGGTARYTTLDVITQYQLLNATMQAPAVTLGANAYHTTFDAFVQYQLLDTDVEVGFFFSSLYFEDIAAASDLLSLGLGKTLASAAGA